MNTYRYAVADDGTITRGRVYNLRDTGCDTSDNWRWYWDADQMVAFYPDTRNYNAPTKNDDTDRVISSYESARGHGMDEDACLTALARRIAGEWGCRNPWDARFVAVHLERDCDLYVLAPDGDLDRAWRDEIEAIYHGDIYRMEVHSWVPRFGAEDDYWQSEDDECEEWYGEDKADAALVKAFPLDEFPAELLVEDRAS